MKYCCINCLGTRRVDQTPSRRRRGTAEVELILLVPVLMTILLLCAMASRLGRARVTNVRDGEQQAYGQVVRGTGVVSSMSLQTVPGVVSVYGDLPTRFDESLPAKEVTLTQGWLNLNGITLHDKGAFLDPTWHFAQYPMNGDAAWVDDSRRLKDWFEAYVDDGRGQDSWLIKYGLGLADSWRP